MFKKTLLAAALAATAFTSAAAVKVSTSAGTTDKAYDVSSQGLPLTKSTTLADVIVTLSSSEASAMASGAKIKLTFAGAFVQTAPSAVPTYADVTPTGGTAADNTFAGDKDSDSTANGTVGNFTGSSYTATSTTLVIPFNAVPVDGDTDDGVSLGDLVKDDTITFANIPLLLSSSAVGSSVTVTAEVLTSTDAAVSGTASAATKVIDVVNQFAAGVKTKADAKIDVANARKTFESKAKTDTVVLEAVTTGSGATATTAKVTLKGDFSDDITKVNDGTNDYAINTAKTEATFTYTTSTSPTVATFLNQDTTLTLTVDGEDAIAPRSFTSSVDLAYTDAESAARTQALATDAASGSWTLNGDNAYISFMPFGSAYSQSITISNKGSVDGEITVDLIANGTSVSKTLTAVAAAHAVTDISSEVRAFAAENGLSNAAVNIVVNSPLGDVNVDALYYSKADKDRGIVLTGGNNAEKP